MTSPTTMEAVIERLEKAVGPDHEINIELARLFNAGTFFHRYTDSLDAAVTLVPPEWRVEHIGEQLSGGTWDAELQWRAYSMAARVHGAGKTAPLALVIAALRARSTPTPSEGE